MRASPLFASLLVMSLGEMSCGQNKTPLSPAHGDDAGVAKPGDVAACEPVKEKAMHLYTLAAETEGIAQDLRTDFSRANVHMVMAECKVRPTLVAPCVLAAPTAAEVETKCLLPLDDAGEVEGRAFARPAR